MGYIFESPLPVTGSEVDDFPCYEKKKKTMLSLTKIYRWLSVCLQVSIPNLNIRLRVNCIVSSF